MPDKWTESLAKVNNELDKALVARLESEVDFLLAVINHYDANLGKKCFEYVENKHGRELEVLTRWYNV